MAAARALAILAVLACAGLAAAQTKPMPAPCKASGRPAIPTNIRVVSNVYDAGSKFSKITLEWTNPTRADDGCTDFYRVQRLKNGAMIAEDGPMLASATQNPVTHSFSIAPGESITTKIWAVNKASQKTSDKVSGPWIKAAEAPPALCDPKGTPVAPINIKVVDNKYEPSSGFTRVTMQWENPTKSNHGCTDFYRVQRLQKGAMVAEDGPQVMATQKIVTHSFLVKPGETYNTKLWAVNKANQKTSPKTQGPTINAVAAPTPQPRGL